MSGLEAHEKVLDPARAEAREMWQRVAASELSPEDQAKRERIRPIVAAYLEGRISREEYEKRLAG